MEWWTAAFTSAGRTSAIVSKATMNATERGHSRNEPYRCDRPHTHQNRAVCSTDHFLLSNISFSFWPRYGNRMAEKIAKKTTRRIHLFSLFGCLHDAPSGGSHACQECPDYPTRASLLTWPWFITHLIDGPFVKLKVTISNDFINFPSGSSPFFLFDDKTFARKWQSAAHIAVFKKNEI